MKMEEKFIAKCLSLAERGFGKVAQNPMVGCILLENGEIIGEGYHEEFGKAHAEVNAINSVKDKSRLKNATLFVNLEPCSHHGKTPPCSDLIISSGIKKVVIGNVDTNPLVGGKGIERLKNAGIEVVSGVLNNECRKLNKRFFTLHEKNRPYVILKWAQTQDNFISRYPVPVNRKENVISCDDARKLVHEWRGQEQAIMVGSKTVWADDPKLTVRLSEGKNPLRVVLDTKLRIPNAARIFNEDARTIVYHDAAFPNTSNKNADFVALSFQGDVIADILKNLASQGISSLIVEGGRQTLESFIEKNLFDEARVFISDKKFNTGIPAPAFHLKHAVETKVGEDILRTYYART